MKIDSHQHFWKYNAEEYGWIDDSMQILKKDYLPPDLQILMEGASVDGTVVVQARQSTRETLWLLELAAKYPFVKGVVGWVDLQSGRLEDQLLELSSHPRLAGVRHVIQDEPDDRFMLRPAFLKGIGMLQHFNLNYDLLVRPKQLHSAAELVSLFPEQKFVLDHLAKPFIGTGTLHPWKEGIEALAAHPNVWCKVSGMVTEADYHGWTYEQFIPYLEIVWNAFGADRLMVGSDWPVCTLAGSYREIMDIPVRFFEPLTPQEKNKIFAQNCIDFYQLDM